MNVLQRFIERLKPFTCGDGIEVITEVPCARKFFNIKEAISHYIKVHRGSCRRIDIGEWEKMNGVN